MEVGVVEDVRRARRPEGPQDWEFHKATIAALYTSMPLKDMIKVMQEDHYFKATENQYKKQLNKWGLDSKKTKAPEYKAMIRKKRAREHADPDRKSAFRLRGSEVDDSQIVRFQKRKKIGDEDELTEADTPRDLVCYTPPSTLLSNVEDNPAEAEIPPCLTNCTSPPIQPPNVICAADFSVPELAGVTRGPSGSYLKDFGFPDLSLDIEPSDIVHETGMSASNLAALSQGAVQSDIAEFKPSDGLLNPCPRDNVSIRVFSMERAVFTLADVEFLPNIARPYIVFDLDHSFDSEQDFIKGHIVGITWRPPSPMAACQPFEGGRGFHLTNQVSIKRSPRCTLTLPQFPYELSLSPSNFLVGHASVRWDALVIVSIRCPEFPIVLRIPRSPPGTPMNEDGCMQILMRIAMAEVKVDTKTRAILLLNPEIDIRDFLHSIPNSVSAKELVRFYSRSPLMFGFIERSAFYRLLPMQGRWEDTFVGE